MEVINCNVVREKIIKDIKIKLNSISKRLKIVVISIGCDRVNDIYLKQNRKLFSSLGIKFEEIKLNSDIEENQVLNLIDNLNINDDVDGIMITLPIVRNNINFEKIINRINYQKDVDGLTNVNRLKLANNEDCLMSSTVVAIMEIFKYYNINLENKKIVIVGNGYLIGKPLSMFLKNNNLDVTVCDSKTKKLNKELIDSEIIISCVGKPNLINLDILKGNKIVIDAGVSIDNGKINGDVKREGLDNVKGFITPLTKGVGGVATASLVSNLINCYEVKMKR